MIGFQVLTIKLEGGDAGELTLGGGGVAAASITPTLGHPTPPGAPHISGVPRVRG